MVEYESEHQNFKHKQHWWDPKMLHDLLVYIRMICICHKIYFGLSHVMMAILIFVLLIIMLFLLKSSN
jgi:hypothetical protein